MSVGANVGFGLKMRGVHKREIQKRVADMLALVKLPDIAKRRPSQLSGGQQQARGIGASFDHRAARLAA